MRTIIALGGCIATFTLISCDRQLQAPDLDPSFGIQQDKDYCQTDPECGGGTNGLIHDQSSSGTLVEPSYDPSPGANGIWLGNTVTGNVCYKNYNASIIDNDGDWLDDNCEYQLAKAFAPSVNMYAYEACPYGEPYWAAKYFDDVLGRGWGEFVRIAYMPAYYEDCGVNGHEGDSEFIMLEVDYNPATKHWEMKSMFLSAHAGTFTNSSEWILDENEIEYPSGRLYSYPRVWVAEKKHANYKSRADCNAGAIGFDECYRHGAYGGRILVYRHRGVGSRLYDRLGCQPSDNLLFYENGRTECFYTRRNFKGWQITSEAGVTPYYDFLISQAFECFAYGGLLISYCYYGAGVKVGP